MGACLQPGAPALKAWAADPCLLVAQGCAQAHRLAGLIAFPLPPRSSYLGLFWPQQLVKEAGWAEL